MSKHNTNNIFQSINSKGLRNFAIIFSVISFTFISTYIGKNCMAGGMTAFISAFTFILLFLLSFPFAMMEITSKNIREQMEVNSYKNSRKILIFGNILTFLYCSISILIITIFMNTISNRLLAFPNASFILKILLPYFLFSSLNMVFRGFFMGAKLKKEQYGSMILEALLSIIFVIIFSGIYDSRAKLAAGLLNIDNIEGILKASGCAVGLSFTSFLIFVINIGLYYKCKKKLAFSDYTRRHIDIYDLANHLTSGSFILGLITIAYPLIIFINQYLYLNYTWEESPSLRIYSFSTLFGVVLMTIICPLLITYLYSFFDRRTVSIAADSGDRHEVRFKITGMLRSFAIVYFPVVMFLCVHSVHITRVFWNTDSSMITGILCLSIFSGIPLGLSMIYINIVIGLRQFIPAFFSGAIAFVVDILCNVFLSSVFGCMYAQILGFYIFAICYAILTMILSKKYTKFTPDFRKTFLRPILAMIISAVISLVLSFVLGLFLPSLAVIIIDAVVVLLAVYWFYIKSGATNYTTVSKSPLAIILLPIGKLFGF